MTSGVRLLLTAEAIQERVHALADRIDGDYSSADELVLVGVLNGAAMFTADLMRSLRKSVQVDFMALASYGASTESTGAVRILKDLKLAATGRHLLVVEDIVDTGLTAAFLSKHLSAQMPASLEFCTLLDKPARRQIPFTPKYIGFEVGNEFVVGYGMDFNEQYRQLPWIGILDAQTPG